MQGLCLLTMEPPTSMSGDALRDAKVAVVRAMPPIKTSDVLVGQYVAHPTDPTKKAYTDDPTVKNKESKCATWVEAALFIENERWEGVPILIQSGKGECSRMFGLRSYKSHCWSSLP